MISQLKVFRVRVEVELFFEVRLIVLSNIMIDQCQGYNERNLCRSVLVYDFEEFLFFICRELFFKIAHCVHQNIGVFTGSRL